MNYVFVYIYYVNKNYLLWEDFRFLCNDEEYVNIKMVLPLLYYTNSGTGVLDAREIKKEDIICTLKKTLSFKFIVPS